MDSDILTDNVYYKQINEQKRQALYVRSEIERLTHTFFFNKDFIFIEPIVLHEAIPNKKNEIYISFYDRKYSLSSSNALFMGTYASEYDKVYTISKCFRSEKKTFNHLIEFSILEVEILNCYLNDMITLIESYIRFILEKLLVSSFIQKYSSLQYRIKQLRDNFAPRVITYDDFISYLPKIMRYKDISDIDYILTMNLNEIFIIVDYPSKLASWTSKKKDDKRSIAMNILLPESYGELCEGCERSNDIELLQHKINMAKANSIQWYIESIKKINTSRCGFGLGIDRMIRWIVGADKISDIHFFPRIGI